MKRPALAFVASAWLFLLPPTGLTQQPPPNPIQNLDTRTPEELYELAVTYFEAGREKAAQDILVRALESRPNFPDVLNLLGVLADRSQLFDESERYFKRALELAPDDASATFNLGLSYMRQGRFELAVGRFERTLDIDPSRLDAVLQAGVANLELHRFGAAKDRLERYVKEQPENGWGQLALGEVYMALSQPLKAIETFEAASLRDGPQRAEALSHLGQAYYNLGQHEKAEQFLDQSLVLEPQNGNALLTKGRVRLDTGQWQEAGALLDSVPQAHPSYREARLFSAVAQSRRGDAQQAVADLQNLVSLWPDYADAYYQLALVYQKLRRTEDAQQALDKFKALQGSDTSR